MQALEIVIMFIFGASIGSFLNVVIYRLPRKLPFLRFGERSHCPFCKKTLEPKDLIPIVSFLFLGGKCRHCKKHISAQYILIESITGLFFVAIFLYSGWTWQLLAQFAVVSFAIPLIVIDARHKIVPDVLSLPFIVVALVVGLLLHPHDWISILLGGVIGAGFFFAQWFVSKGRWIGSGDIRLGAAMGFLLGWEHLLLALTLAYLSGTVVAIIALLFRLTKLKSTIAFGPYLLVATIVAFFFAQPIIDWYLDLIWIVMSPV